MRTTEGGSFGAGRKTRQFFGTAESRAMQIFRNHSEWSENQSAQSIHPLPPEKRHPLDAFFQLYLFLAEQVVFTS